MAVSEKHWTELIGFAECWMLWAREPVTQDGTIYQEKVEEAHVWGRGRKQSFRHVESEVLVRHSCYCEGGAIPILPARHKATEAEIVYTTCHWQSEKSDPDLPPKSMQSIPMPCTMIPCLKKAPNTQQAELQSWLSSSGGRSVFPRSHHAGRRDHLASKARRWYSYFKAFLPTHVSA